MRDLSANLLFISYAHDDSREIAVRLKTDLEEHGYQVWMDDHGLRAGLAWTLAIQEALRNAQVVIAMLSPQAVRATHQDPGFCLKEIEFASHVNPPKPIVPVLVKQCEIPISICLLQYVDLRGFQSEEEYEKRLKELLETIKKAVHEPPRYRSWKEQLLPREWYVPKKPAIFCGREWLFEKIDEWRKGSGSALLIKGDPGTGKSAIVSELIHTNPDGQVIAYHCCRADSKDSLDPICFIRTVAAMIAGRLTSYEAKLQDELIKKALDEQNCSANPVGAFQDGILVPLRTIMPQPNPGSYIIIDALDEALLFGSQENIVTLLARSLGEMPEWLKIIATTRKEPEILSCFAGLEATELDAQSRENDQDIQSYIQSRLKDTKLKELIHAAHRSEEAVASLLQKKSLGNFLYLQQVTTGLRNGTYRFDELDELPPGLAAMYRRFFKRKFPTATDYRPVRPVLEAIVAANEPLTRAQLTAATRLEKGALSTALSLLGAYLPERISDGRPVRALYHKSLADWLTSTHEVNGPGEAHYIDAREGSKALASMSWDNYRVKQAKSDLTAAEIRSYAFGYGVLHLLESDRFADAIDFLDFLLHAPLDRDVPSASRLGQLTKTVSIALRQCQALEASKIAPQKLASLLKRLYEVEPLAGGIQVLVKFQHDQWATVLDDFLKTDDYVVRFAISKALAEIYLEDTDASTFQPIIDLIQNNEINRRELGGYAFRHVCARRPSCIDPELVERLAGGDSYVERSVVGELLLSLTLHGFKEPTAAVLVPQKLVTQSRFWNPIWEFNMRDIWNLRAAQYLHDDTQPPDTLDEGVNAAYEDLKWAHQFREELLQRPVIASESRLSGLLQMRSFYSLDLDTTPIRAAEEDLKRNPELKSIMQVLFSHPLWEVTEAAASVLSSIAWTKSDVREMIEELLGDTHWRVCYGAIEAAFASRYFDNYKSFTKAVRCFYNAKNCMLRALCAENLTAWIIDCAPEHRDHVLRQFSNEISYWVLDEDCWVLEHVYRLFGRLMQEGQDVKSWMSKGVSRLFNGNPKWFCCDRGTFLQLIEDEKRKLHGHELSRIFSAQQ